VQTYDRMAIGEHSRETDLEVSPPISILDILVYGYLWILISALCQKKRKSSFHEPGSFNAVVPIPHARFIHQWILEVQLSLYLELLVWADLNC
jgi:hypothetical protein